MSESLTLITRSDFSVQITGDAQERKIEALAILSTVRKVDSEGRQQAAVNAIAFSKALRADIERQRVELTAPVLKLQRDIKSAADTFVEDLERSENNVHKLLDDFQEAEQERQRQDDERRRKEIEAEQRRLAEEARAAERERIRIEQEKQREIQELERLACEAASTAVRESLRAEADQAKLAEAARLAAEDKKREEEQMRQAEQLETKRLEMGPPMTARVAEGQMVKQEMDYEVENLHQLYLARGQECCELKPRRAVIKALINGGGVKVIPGIRIFPILKNQVRAQKAQKAIDLIP